MNRAILGAGRGPWIVGLIVFSGGLLVASPTIAWYWLPLTLLLVAGVAWFLTDRESESQTGNYESNPDASTDREAALDTLKQQYAVGEIGDAEFERRLETLLENETIADVETRVDADSEAANETEHAEQESRKQTPHHRHKCYRRGKHHHGRH
ncbi:SHOCT domain-containing protein [Halorussus salinisoli]|uniref:SHOCT domain-containing protein n=1 Tax=Halorussus salinisoli TaxID=2558242 RepID=UPI0010C24650|nr:SHOCT domain-containing protein [Halorussus salinisoli]